MRAKLWKNSSCYSYQDSFLPRSQALQCLTHALQSWNSKSVGHIKTQLALAQEVLHRLEMAQDMRLLTPDEDWLRRELKRHCLRLASLETTIVRLRSRVRHLRDRDANTSCFHKQAAYHRRKNFIPKLVDGDRVVTSHEEKQEVLYEFMKVCLA